MSDFLTQREVNCFALYLNRNSWSISEIARLLDISESAAISKIYNAMELEGKITIERIIHCTLRNGKSLNYELDAEFYLGDAYHALYYMNHMNIEEVANYIQSEGDDDIPPEIVLSYDEKQNSVWRNKIYHYACNKDANINAYEEACIRFKAIIENGIDGFEIWNANDDKMAGRDFVQERIDRGFREIIEAYNKLTAHDSQVDMYYHNMNALARSFVLLGDRTFDPGAYDFSNIESFKSRISQASSRYSASLYDYENWHDYEFYFNAGLVNSLTRSADAYRVVLYTNFRHEIITPGYSMYDIYKMFKKINGIGIQGISNILWWRVYAPVLKLETDKRRKHLIDIRDNEAKKILAMSVDEANSYLEEHYGKEAHLWEK